jgi:epoxyqueuosine reductase
LVESSELDRLVKDRARALGFDAVGVARADVPLDADVERYRAFLEGGMHGEMRWLADGAEVRARLDGDAILPGAKSVVCVARRYQRSAEEEAGDPPFARRIARYARGRDYHNGVRKKLRQLAAYLRTLGTPDAPVHARPMVDDVPVLERAWAARAGLGFVGKNGMLIVPGEGSFVLLGEVVTTLALTPDAPMPERCGSCTRCLQACPTGAFPAPFVLDARRCVSYLTIELRGAIPEELRVAIGEHLFGCDDCQTVCPFNQSARPRDPEATRPFRPHARWSETEVVDLLALGRPPAGAGAEADAEADADATWRAVSEGSPLHRATAEGLARNAAVVLGNANAVDSASDAVATRALEEAARGHPSPVVRDAAAWALAKRAGVARPA